MSFFSSMSITSSGLTMQRLRMDVISQNIANVDTTKTQSGGPYRRKMVIVEEDKDFRSLLNKELAGNQSSSQNGMHGVKVKKIVEDKRPFNMIYDPGHPEADDNGYVKKPNINIVEEMTNMISATRAYEANVTCLNGSKGMAMKALEIGR